jgi:hypothetical protein
MNERGMLSGEDLGIREIVDKPAAGGNGGKQKKRPVSEFDDQLPRGNGGASKGADSPRPVTFKTLAAFVAEYVPLAYTVDPIIRGGSLYTLTAKTGTGTGVRRRNRSPRHSRTRGRKRPRRLSHRREP